MHHKLPVGLRNKSRKHLGSIGSPPFLCAVNAAGHSDAEASSHVVRACSKHHAVCLKKKTGNGGFIWFIMDKILLKWMIYKPNYGDF